MGEEARIKQRDIPWYKLPRKFLIDLSNCGIDPAKLKWIEIDYSGEDDNIREEQSDN